jgi:hypothetical protein
VGVGVSLIEIRLGKLMVVRRERVVRHESGVDGAWFDLGMTTMMVDEGIPLMVILMAMVMMWAETWALFYFHHSHDRVSEGPSVFGGDDDGLI